jgi:RNA polymerase primary sigma factor
MTSAESDARNDASPLVGLRELLDRIEGDSPEISSAVLQREVDQLLGRRRTSVSAPGASSAKQSQSGKRPKGRAFDWYQRIVAESQPLSQDAAARCAAAAEAGLFAEERLDLLSPYGTHREEVTELEILAYEGRGAYDLLVLSNIRLVFHWCKGVARSLGTDAVQDAFQAGCIGLMRGIQGWDFRMGFTLSTYVSWHVRQAIQRWRKNETSLIRLPVHVWEQLESPEPRLTQETRMAAERALRVVSLDEIDAEAEAGVWDGGLEEALDNAERQRIVAAAFSVLTERESMVLRLRHGVSDVSSEPMTLEEIGQFYGVTRERIRQIESKAVKKIQELGPDLARHL